MKLKIIFNIYSIDFKKFTFVIGIEPRMIRVSFAKTDPNPRRNSFRGPADVEKKFKQWDEDGDGKISFEELKVLSVSEARAYL